MSPLRTKGSTSHRGLPRFPNFSTGVGSVNPHTLAWQRSLSFNTAVHLKASQTAASLQARATKGRHPLSLCPLLIRVIVISSPGAGNEHLFCLTQMVDGVQARTELKPAYLGSVASTTCWQEDRGHGEQSPAKGLTAFQRYKLVPGIQ